jgi:hypothetical protein
MRLWIRAPAKLIPRVWGGRGMGLRPKVSASAAQPGMAPSRNIAFAPKALRITAPKGGAKACATAKQLENKPIR